MHLYLFIRGKLEQCEVWKCHAQCAYWKWRRINKETGKEETIIVQGALRPSVFGAYEYIFPKEALAEVCSFFGIVNYGVPSLDLDNPLKQLKGKLKMKLIAEIFGCKTIPKEILKAAAKIPPSFTTEEFERGGANCIIPGVAVHIIGIKDDKTIELGGYIQEAL